MKEIVDWKKTLNLIIHCHKEDSITFRIKDVEELYETIKVVEAKAVSYTETIKQLKLENDRLRSKLLVSALQKSNTVSADEFKVYA